MSDVIHVLGVYPAMSRDYRRLVQLMKVSSVICVVDYRTGSDGPALRDVAHTLYHENSMWEICSRGHGYVTGFTEQEFVDGCEEYNVEFLEPGKV